MQRISILGSTGSIGCNTVDILLQHKDRFCVEALTGMENVDLLARQARKLGAKLAVIGNPAHYTALKDALAGSGIEAAAGEESIAQAARRPVDTLVAAIVGAAGLKPTLAAIECGTRIALANKECLVMAGELVNRRLRAGGGALIPVDSEHSGIFQALDRTRMELVQSITLTASGGPFRTHSFKQMKTATPAQAIKHPNWSMGAKISVDSATLMNKGLELLEACYLFSLPESIMDIIIHPESIVHALVAYVDQSVIAQASAPDMRAPIAYALSWPERIATSVERLDLATLGKLTFEALDGARFPAPSLARGAFKAGGNAPAILNAANEIAVEAFLKNRIGFLDIVKIVEKTLEKAENTPISTLEDVLCADNMARGLASSFIA